MLHVMDEDTNTPVPQGSPSLYIQLFVPPADADVLLLPRSLPKAGEQGTVSDRQKTPRAPTLWAVLMNSQIWLKPSSCELLQVVAERVGLDLSESYWFFRALKDGEVGSQISGTGCLWADVPK